MVLIADEIGRSRGGCCVHWGRIYPQTLPIDHYFYYAQRSLM
ncbi:hypothetical protein HMPREF1861_02183 [Corynebacterium kroppenstedtii]|nr:hypothetical protein HMPREF1861_02183 [Corynebacterium kroppenstedtii]